jgi:hypothetical protein
LLCSVSFALAAEPSVIEGAKKEAALVFYTTMDIQNSKPLLDALPRSIRSFAPTWCAWAALRW